MFRQAIEGVLGYRLVDGVEVPPADPDATPEELGEAQVTRFVEESPLPRPDHSGPVNVPDDARQAALTPSPWERAGVRGVDR